MSDITVDHGFVERGFAVYQGQCQPFFLEYGRIADPAQRLPDFLEEYVRSIPIPGVVNYASKINHGEVYPAG